MELYKMIFQRLVNDDTLEELLASYNDRPAVFYQHPATSDDPEWGKVQYPRIDYIVDIFMIVVVFTVRIVESCVVDVLCWIGAWAGDVAAIRTCPGFKSSSLAG